MRRNSELENLHPLMREKVLALTDKLAAVNNPLKIFEGYRTPERQHYLFSQGRTRPGRRVTNADAWSSYHQYGVACDFVLFIDGKWSWKTSGEFKNYWEQLHKFGREVGLMPLSWELPHLQIEDITLQDLRAGNYPDNGDASWAENLYSAITNWRKSATPPLPNVEVGRPAIEQDEETVEAVLSDSESVSHSQRYRITARSGLRMRSGPGTSFDVVTVLSPNQIVEVVNKNGDWYQVDLQGDGLADGFCHSGFLQVSN